MIKRRIDPSKLDLAPQYTPQDRARLLEQAQFKAEGARAVDTNHGSSAKQIAEKLESRGLFLSMEDLMGMPSRRQEQMIDRYDAFQGMDTETGGRQMLTEEFPTNHDDALMEEIYGRYAPGRPMQEDEPDRFAPGRPIRQMPQRTQQRQVPQRQAPQRQAPQRQMLREQIIGQSPPQSNRGGPPWGLKAFIGETKSGNQIPVWKVQNSRTGTLLNTMFRVESVAQKVAMLLNESGDSNDPRALQITQLYEKRDKLLKEARVLEKTAAGKPMKSDRLRVIRDEINQLDYRLGI